MIGDIFTKKLKNLFYWNNNNLPKKLSIFLKKKKI